MATVTKNFRIKSGLIVEGTSGTINGHNILTESTSGDQYILNLVGGATLVKSVDSMLTVDGSGKLTINANTYDAYGSASAAQSAAATDATNKANQALSDAQTFATNAANGAQSAAETAASNALSSAVSNLEGQISDAESNANAYTNNAISGEVSDRNSAINSAISTEVSDRNSAINSAISTEVSDRNSAIATAKGEAIYDANAYTDTKVADLVDSAPALLDTLNELAAAIADNPNYASDVANLVATKADKTYVDSEISDLNTLAQGYASSAQSAAEATASADATSKANAAQSAAEATASADATSKANAAQAAAEATASADATSKANAAQAAAEATAQAALNDVLDATTPFTDLNINDVAKQVAARTTSLGSVAVTAYQFNKSAFKSGKFLVKIDNGTHNEISEILVTLDSSDNVAITEYAIVGTNGSRGTITADVDSTHCRIRVTPVNDSTITVSGTVFNA